ncbi:MAG TPA: LytTR family DNA-binding domain-containing protein [Puia sp.]|nr:LytTR family DNA-binding domain-containing protein [Puia sp.]
MKNTQPFFFLRLERRFERINYSDIRYIQSSSNYCKIHLVDKMILTLVTLRQLEFALPSNDFCRIHRSFIVRIEEITAFDHKAVDLGDIRLPLGETYQEELENRVQIVRTPEQQKAYINEV